MTISTQVPKRKKINFMVDQELLKEIHSYIPEGERSDFANLAFAEALENFKRKKAMEAIDAFRNGKKLRLTTKEIIKARNYGRK